MQIVSEYIALLQDDVDPKNATEERHCCWQIEEVSGFVTPEKRSPAIIAGGAVQLIIVCLQRCQPVFSPCTIASLIDDSVLTRHGEFSACGRSIFIYRAAGIFARGSCKGNTSGVFLIGTAHASVKRGYLFSEPGGNSTASIVGFGPVKRDAEKCTTGTTRHAWIQIAHNSPVQLKIVKRTAVHRM